MHLTSILIAFIVICMAIICVRKRAIIQQLTWKERFIALGLTSILFVITVVGYHFIDYGVCLLEATNLTRILVWFVYNFIAFCLVAVILEKYLPEKLVHALVRHT